MFKKVISYLVILSILWIDIAPAMKRETGLERNEDEREKTPLLQKKVPPTSNGSSSEKEEDEPFLTPQSFSNNEFQKRGSQILNQPGENINESSPLLRSHEKELIPIKSKTDQSGISPFSKPSSLRDINLSGSFQRGFLNGDDYDEEPDLKEAGIRLTKAEKRPFYIKWVYMDHLVEKIAYSFCLKKEDVTGASLKGCHSPEPLWIEGRGIPLKTGYSTARAISGFRQGVEFVLKRSLSLTLQGLLIYQIVFQIQHDEGVQPRKLLNIVRDGDEQSIKGALAVIVQNPVHAPYYLSFLAVPFVWGLVKTILFARRAVNDTPESFERSVKVVESFSGASPRKGRASLWKDNLRWFLPLHPIDREINYLVYRLLLDGSLTPQQRKEALKALIDFTHNTRGWSKIAGLSALQKITAGTSLSQMDLVEKTFGKDYKNVLVKEKMRAYEELYKQNPGIRKAGARGLVHNLYAHYLRWTLGDFDGWKSGFTWAVFKGAFLGLTINLFIKIGSQIISYLKCPNPLQKGFTYTMEKAKYTSAYTSQCLLAYLDNFNKVPNQPVDTILKILPNFTNNIDPTQFTNQNFSGRGLTGKQIGPLIRGLQHQLGINFVSLDLSNNNIGKDVDDMEALFPLPSSLTYLDLSGNLIGIHNENTEIVLGKALPTLPQLQTLKLAGSVEGGIGSLGDAGTVVIGNGLHFLTNLQYLDLSMNQIGYKRDKGTVAIGEGLRSLKDLLSLDLSENQIGYQGDKGTVAIGESFPFISKLQYLALWNNNIGTRANDGTVAIGNGLSSVKDLLSLDLSGNNIGSFGDNGRVAIGNGLRSLKSLQYLNLSNNQIGSLEGNGTIAIGNGLCALKALQYLGLSGNAIGSLKGNGTVAIGNGLRSLTNLLHLDLSWNNVGSFGDDGTAAIGESFPYLSKLQYLDLSNNQIGSQGSNGTLAIGNGLLFLKDLQYLDFSKNFIGGPVSTDTVNITVDSIVTLKFLTTLSVQQQNISFFPLSEMLRLRQYWNNRNNQTDIFWLRSLEDIEAYFNNLPNDTTTVSLPGWFYPNNIEVIKAFMKKLVFFPLLQYLDLSWNNLGFLGDDGIIAIGNGLRSLTNLLHLDLSWNAIDTDGLATIDESFPYLSNLQYLSLSGNNAGIQGDEKMVTAWEGLHSLKALQYLDLSGIEVSSDGTVAIGESFPYLSNLQYLSLSALAIGIWTDNGTVAIGHGLRSLKDLQYLDLSRNFIGSQGDNGAITISNALSFLPNLQMLDLSENKIGFLSDIGTAAIARTLPSLTHLKLFDISSNPLGNNSSQALYSLSDALGSLLCQGTTCIIQDSGLMDLPWDQASASRGAYYSSQIQRACEANQCFGTPVSSPDKGGCVPSSASSLEPLPIFKIFGFLRKSEHHHFSPPLLSESLPQGTDMVLYQGARPPALWEAFKDRTSLFYRYFQEDNEFQPSAVGLFFSSALRGAATTFILGITQDGLESRGISKHVVKRAMILTQAGIIIYMTASSIPALTGIAVNDALTYIGAPPSLSSALGNTAAIVVSIAQGDVITPTSLITSMGGGIIGSTLAIKAKDKISSWLWKSETIDNIKDKIRSSWDYMWDMASYFGG